MREASKLQPFLSSQLSIYWKLQFGTFYSPGFCISPLPCFSFLLLCQNGTFISVFFLLVYFLWLMHAFPLFCPRVSMIYQQTPTSCTCCRTLVISADLWPVWGRTASPQSLSKMSAAKSSQQFGRFSLEHLKTKLPSAFCWCSVVSRCIGRRASLPIVHFNCTPHKKQKHPLGRHRVSLSLSNRHIQAHSVPHNQSRLNTQTHTQTFSLSPLPQLTQAHSRGAIFKSSICIGNRTKIFFRLKQNVFSCQHQQF